MSSVYSLSIGGIGFLNQQLLSAVFTVHVFSSVFLHITVLLTMLNQKKSFSVLITSFPQRLGSTELKMGVKRCCCDSVSCSDPAASRHGGGLLQQSSGASQSRSSGKGSSAG